MSGHIPKLPNNEGASVMADRGFTICDQLNEVGVELLSLIVRSSYLPAKCKRAILHLCEYMWREQLGELRII